VILRLPYHGEIDKRLVRWDQISPEVLDKLEDLKREGLVQDEGGRLAITKLGWYWYVNMMYYLMPREDQRVMNGMVVQQLKHPGRSFTRKELLYPVIPLQAA